MKLNYIRMNVFLKIKYIIFKIKNDKDSKASSSSTKIIILNHINIFHNIKNNIKDGKPRSFSNIFMFSWIL